jgi:16S rRNA (guanine966-N2)-methyltransferase
MRKRAQGHNTASQLRIIGGQWRGRKLAFTPQPGLRPTGDRIRETLFNWVAAEIRDAHCADLFAGSGALGLESLSRGAAHCDFIDTSSAASQQISEHLQMLGATDRGTCLTGTAQSYLQSRSPASLDLVFVDPPFDRGLAGPSCALLAQRQLLVRGGLVYLECRCDESIPLPAQWRVHRDKQTGDVRYRLLVST